MNPHAITSTAFDWRVSRYKNVEVTNDTADLYKYYDCTENAEFLYDCVRQTVEIDLPREIDYLKRHDEALNSIMEAVEMPDRLAQALQMNTKLPPPLLFFYQQCCV